MVGIGINQNVYLVKAEITPNTNVIELVFGEIDKVEAKKMDLFDLLDSDTVVDTVNDSSIKLFPPMPPKEGNDRTEEKNVEMLVNDINGTKAVLTHILRGYLTSDEVIGKLKPFAGLPIDKDNLKTQVQKKDILMAIHKNMGMQFIQLITPFLDKPQHAFRLLLVRQSQDKAYPTFRKKYLDENPFYESMEIKYSENQEENQSKVKFTSYEIDNGLNSAAAIAKDAKSAKGSTSKAVTDQPPRTVGNVFG